MDGSGDQRDSNSQPFIQKLHDYLHRSEWYTPYLAMLEARTGVKREYLLLGAFFAFLAFLVLGIAGELCCLFVGIIYPAYQTIRVVENNETAEFIKWLKYWVVFCSFNLFEFFNYFILGLVPFYWLLKCLFLVWCFAPVRNNGSVVVYAYVVNYLKSEFSSVVPIDISDRGFDTASTSAAPPEREFNLRPRKDKKSPE